MRWSLLILGIIFLFGAAGAWPLQFQNSGDNNSVNYPGLGGGYWRANLSGGNSYAYGGTFTCIENKVPVTFTYAAFRDYGSQNLGCIELYDSSHTRRTQWCGVGGSGISEYTDVYEVNVIGGTPYMYRNGILGYTGSVLAQNPSYVALCNGYSPGDARVDDFVLGTPSWIVDVPQSNAYYIKKDMVNPAASGFYNYTTGALVFSNAMPISFSRPNISAQALLNETLTLTNVDTGTGYSTAYTGTASSADLNINLTPMFQSGVPYGLYWVKLNTTYSDVIAYIADGANLLFNQRTYSTGDTATLTYSIDSGGYWDTSLYTYKIVIIDAFGNVVDSQAINTQTGTVTYTWTTDNNPGAYYGELIATPIGGGNEILMIYDYCTLVATFGFTGYVNEDESGLPISGATVKYSQGSVNVSITTTASGNYSTGALFLTGSAIWANTSNTGYQNDNWTFIVMNGHTISRNITLQKSSHTTTDITAGGVARDGILGADGYTVTGGYGRPIEGATVYLSNSTTGENWTTTTNIAGFYNVTRLGPYVYQIRGSKTGYKNSPIYDKLMVGV